MTLKDLARAALIKAGSPVPVLSHGTVPRRVPVGHHGRTDAHTDFASCGTTVPSGTVRQAGTLGTDGTTGTTGTGGTFGTVRQLLPDDFEERAAILEYKAGLPRDWAEAFARHLVAGPPGDFLATRWHAAIDGALRFTDEWGKEAYRLGWHVDDVFGLHRACPAARYDGRGLAWLLGDGSRVIEINARAAVIRNLKGTRLSYARSSHTQPLRANAAETHPRGN